jgi:hypothetical protein
MKTVTRTRTRVRGYVDSSCVTYPFSTTSLTRYILFPFYHVHVSDEEEMWEERLRILDEARNLKTVASWFLRPEQPVASCVGCASNCFDRASILEPIPSFDEEEEKDAVLKEAVALQSWAHAYLHPEEPVRVTDPCACGRNYFSRFGAAEYDDDDTDAERDDVLEDVKMLKASAAQFLHPERPVEASPSACARNYFSRASAPEYDDSEMEREALMEDLKMLKASAAHYLHPELPVVASPSACARNYFSRPSAPEYDDVEEDLERDAMMEDLKMLKASAVQYLHPELPLLSSPSACARSYFSRPSAPEYDDADEDLERDAMMEDLKMLKASAVQYLHPELPLVSSPSACARNFFTRPSAPEYGEVEEDLEREYALEDVKALKASAAQFLHPERPVMSSPAACARSYFSRPYATEYEEDEQDLEREYVLEDVKALKASAAQYLHPELPVQVSPLAGARSYFTRPSAPEYGEVEGDLQRDSMLEDMQMLKAAAVQYLHPEIPVVSSPSACARSYFTRPSAPEYDEDEQDLERDSVLEDMQMLKAAAVQFLHPERPVMSSPSACVRSYFTRPSAPEYDEDEQDLERDYVLEDATALKASAAQYLHPERPVMSSPSACARSYFSRPSAPEYEEDEQDLERDYALEDVKALKESAAQYLHPEVHVMSSIAVTRRVDVGTGGVDDERAKILEDVRLLKAIAAQYLHPEQAVKVSPEVSARCYFTRPSADLYESEEESAARAEALKDVQNLKALAAQYRAPEAPVVVDPEVAGRNYFDRASAVVADGADEDASAEGREQVLADALALKKLAVDFMHPEMGMANRSVAAGRSYFDRPSAHEHDHMVHTFPVHEDDMHHDDHHHDEHMDHFGMDEEMEARFDDLRNHLPMGLKSKASISGMAQGSSGSDEEGKLSRSPSSVMLFTEESIYD